MDEAKLTQAIGAALDAYGPLNGSVRLNIHELAELRVEQMLVEQSDGKTDATVSVGREHFTAIVMGEMDPLTAVMTGKVKIQGSLKITGAFAKILAKARQDGLI